MQTKTADVKSKGVVVGVAEFPEYETLEEASQDLGEEHLLGLLNAQIKTNSMNDVRAAATGKPSKSKLQAMAIARLTPEDFQSVAGDESAIQRLIEKKMDEIEAEIEASRPAQAAQEEATADME